MITNNLITNGRSKAKLLVTQAVIVILEKQDASNESAGPADCTAAFKDDVHKWSARRFPPVSEEAEVGTPVGTIMAAAVNQTIIYSIVEGNEGGEWAAITAVTGFSSAGAGAMLRTGLRLKLLHPLCVSRRVHFKWDDGSGFHSQRPGLREQFQLCSKGGGRLHHSGVIQPPSSLQKWVKSIQIKLYW